MFALSSACSMRDVDQEATVPNLPRTDPSSTAILKWELRVGKIGILVIDDDPKSQAVLRQVLDSEEWLVQITPRKQALNELANGSWTLVIADTATKGLSGPLYSILRDLALAPASESGKARLRVLFLVAEGSGTHITAILESERLPYAFKPFNFHDMLDKISDLLMETDAISAPIRRVRQEGGLSVRRNSLSKPRQNSGRNQSMFAAREAYIMTEEEIAEY